MKKLLLTLIAVLYLTTAHPQNYFHMNITEMEPEIYSFCESEYDGIVIARDPDCNSFAWTVQAFPTGESHYYTTDEITVTPDMGNRFQINYNDGCTIHSRLFVIEFHNFQVTEPWFQDFIWKRTGTNVTLEAPYGDDLQYQWSNGSHQRTITVTQPGTYWVRIYNDCGELNDTIQVRDNVEIYRSGVDPATNKNRVLWQTTPEQAAYISNVKVERDGMVVGTVPYTDGEFLDNIGSENAARIYKITAIDNNGDECPLPSYQFGTFNTIISPDIANPSLMNFTWEDPFIEEGSPYSVVTYRIGRFNETTGEFTAIDQLSAQVHIGKYNMDLFDGDYGIVAAVFNDAKNRDYEELAFSNRSDNEILAVGENEATAFKVYPNPANGILFVETRRATSLPGETYRIMNPIGQTVMQGEITSEKQQIDVRNLPQGVYFITVGGETRKFVVE